MHASRAAPLFSHPHGCSANEVPLTAYPCFSTMGTRVPREIAGGAERSSDWPVPGGLLRSNYSPATVSSEAAQLLTVVVSGLAGLVVGSFLNVAVYRLPLRMSVVRPPSHCPSCDAQLTLVDLVPVASWIWLRGRCRHCGAHISWRYPLVELCAGVLCAGAAAALGSVWPLASIAVLFVCTLGAAVVDIDGGLVPSEFAVAASLAALSLVPIAVVVGHADRIIWGALGALLGFFAAIAGDRAADRRRWVRVALLTGLAWSAGWLWPGGGAFVAAWVVVASGAVGLGTGRRAPFAMLAAGSLAAVFASALISRP